MNFTKNELVFINKYWIWSGLYLPEFIPTGYVVRLKPEHLKTITAPLTSYLECTVSRRG